MFGTEGEPQADTERIRIRRFRRRRRGRGSPNDAPRQAEKSQDQKEEVMPKIDQADVVKTYKAFAAKLLRNPDDWEALIDQTALLLDNTDRKRSQYYVSLARRAYRNAPDEVITMFNLGSALQRAGTGARSCRTLRTMRCQERPEMACQHHAPHRHCRACAGPEQEGDRILRQGVRTHAGASRHQEGSGAWHCSPTTSSAKACRSSNAARNSPTRN